MRYFLLVFSLVFSANTSAHFDDVSSNHPQYTAIDYVFHEGIVSGYGDQTFRPDTTINRVEFLKILLEANPQWQNTCRFAPNLYTDTEDQGWYMNYVYIATCENIVEGYSDGSFHPADIITYAEAAKIINGVYEFNDPVGNPWYQHFINRLGMEGATPRGGIAAGDALTRGEMAEIIYRLQGGETSAHVSSDYLGTYTINDAQYGTQTTVTVSGGQRTIQTNALPNHTTGTFPGPGNPNAISAQNDSYTFPLTPTYRGTAADTRTPGIAINGVKFEPGTAERVNCSSGEEYRVEAFQDVLSLGLDANNAHVQPTGAYHYHGIPWPLTKQYSDPIHVGFAQDGHLMYYSPNNTYRSSYQLSTTPRSGTNCDYSVPFGPQGISLNNTAPDGTFTSDWVYTPGSGNLDECNGTTINGQYAYVITDTFPYISRCLKGAFTETRPSGGPPGGRRPPRR